MSKKGFTLMELLVVVIIIATFATMAYPSFRSVIERSRASEAIHMVGAIQAAQQKHFVNYEVYGDVFSDINDFEPAIPDFDASQDHFNTEYFSYQLMPETNRVVATRIDRQGNELPERGYLIIGVYNENFIRCEVTEDEGEKVCASLTDRNKTGTFYPIF